MSDLKESYLTIVKRTIWYLIKTQDFGLWYPHGQNFDLIGNSDVDFEGDKNDQKNTGGTYQLLGYAQYLGIAKSKLPLHYPSRGTNV